MLQTTDWTVIINLRVVDSNGARLSVCFTYSRISLVNYIYIVSTPRYLYTLVCAWTVLLDAMSLTLEKQEA